MTITTQAHESPAATRRRSIMLGTYSATATFYTGFMDTAAYMQSHGVDVECAVYEYAVIGRSMASIAGRFLASGAQGLLCVDPHASWHPRTLAWVLNASFASGAILCASEQTLQADKRRDAEKTVVETDEAPCDFVFVPRTIAVGLRAEHGDLVYRESHLAHDSIDLFGLMARGGRVYGEWRSFLARCRDAGYAVKALQHVDAAVES